MNAKILDPRGPRRKRSSKTIRRFLSVAGLLPGTAARSADRHDAGEPCDLIPVWDAKLGVFRDVDPDDRHDPLREPARQLASLRAALSRDDSAPATSRAPDPPRGLAEASNRPLDEPPRSPFGGTNRVAHDSADE